jgi:hypothetical protein
VLHLKSGIQEEYVSSQRLVKTVYQYGITRLNPRSDGMFKERATGSDDATIGSWLSSAFKLSFKELWTRNSMVMEQYPNLDVRVEVLNKHSELVSEEARCIVDLAKSSGLVKAANSREAEIPQALKVDSHSYVKWKLCQNDGANVDLKTVQCSDLCRDVLTRGAEVFVEMQVEYEANFGARMVDYDRKVKGCGDKIDSAGAKGASSGHLSLSHVGLGLCA